MNYYEMKELISKAADNKSNINPSPTEEIIIDFGETVIDFFLYLN